MLSSTRNALFLTTLLLSSFSNLILATPIYETSISSNSTASYTPSLSVLAPSPSSTIVAYPSNPTTNNTTSTSTILITSPTGTSISNGTSGSNSTTPSATGRPLSPSVTPVSTSAATSFRELGFGSMAMAVVVAFAVAGL
ncbi:hypothetical protein BKA64DRAFT_682464 [Cadophora sp. MPI-SDFR-AT-0126]|nr:hypothetical protein BKA64DRAFT_682464 [Leotiomycetes sp. MPI-SDFR-AT-0126]